MERDRACIYFLIKLLASKNFLLIFNDIKKIEEKIEKGSWIERKVSKKEREKEITIKCILVRINIL